MSKEASRQMVQAAIDSVMKSMPKPQVLTPEQECLERAAVKIGKAKQNFMSHYKLLPVPPTFDGAVEMIYPMLRSEFKDWSKDDFATLACMTLSINAANSLRDHLT
jgi:hypothetical protein